MIPIIVLASMIEITLFGWLGAWLLSVMLASLGRIGVLAWREGRRYGDVGVSHVPDARFSRGSI